MASVGDPRKTLAHHTDAVRTSASRQNVSEVGDNIAGSTSTEVTHDDPGFCETALAGQPGDPLPDQHDCEDEQEDGHQGGVVVG